LKHKHKKQKTKLTRVHLIVAVLVFVALVILALPFAMDRNLLSSNSGTYDTETSGTNYYDTPGTPATTPSLSDLEQPPETPTDTSITPTPEPAPSPAPVPKPAAPAPSPAPAPSASVKEIASEGQCPGQSSIAATATVLVCMSSFARQAHGLGNIGSNNYLMLASGAKAQDIKDCGFSHTACGRAWNHWFGASGYIPGCQAENIAVGQLTPGAVFEAWMKSTGHRANILNTTFDDLGVAHLDNTGGRIWVMHLGGC
jgi:uncharacterized protein YkwD